MTVHFDQLDENLTSASSPVGLISSVKRSGKYRNFFKRAFDLVMIVISAPIVLPVIGVLALAVARDGHAPFYRNCRVGKNGKNFKMLKLRTMVPKADDLLARHLETDAAAKAEWDATQKLKNDPRITAFGLFLRKSSLDELPQLWNVLVGHMSLVGPRPMLPSQRALYPGVSYFSMRPGLTGMWQVSDRNNSEFAKRADHDREYDQKMSFLLDIQLLVKTVSVVLRGTGY